YSQYKAISSFNMMNQRAKYSWISKGIPSSYLNIRYRRQRIFLGPILSIIITFCISITLYIFIIFLILIIFSFFITIVIFILLIFLSITIIFIHHLFNLILT